MPLESGSFINDLTPSNPPNSDPAGQGDDHLRLIKSCVQGTFPQMGAVFGRVVSQDIATSISALWNTNHFVCSASATTTVVLTLPSSGSVTSGFFIDITTVGTGTVSLLPSGAASINGAASLSIPRLSTTRAYFQGTLTWLADTVPHAQGGTSVLGNVAVDGTLSVSGNATFNNVTISGAAVLNSTLVVKGTATISGAAVLAGGLSVSGASVLNGPLTVAGTTTLSGTVVLSNGQLLFPATQNASSNANMLDDYEEGTWTPTLTFATPGNVNVVYSIRTGEYTKVGDTVALSMHINTSTFTQTTASGLAQVTGLPFPAKTTANHIYTGAVGAFIGTVGTGFTYVASLLASAASLLTFAANNCPDGSFVGYSAAGFTTGVSKEIVTNLTYKTAT